MAAANPGAGMIEGDTSGAMNARIARPTRGAMRAVPAL